MAYADASPRDVRGVFGRLPITLAGTCLRGDALTDDSGWKRAGAATSTAIYVAGAGGESGDVITAYVGAYVAGFTGATLGEDVALAASGAYGEGDGQVVGQFISTTEAYIGPRNVPETVGS